MDCLKSGAQKFTLIIDDPVDNCFILNRYYPDEDKDVEIEEYERSEEVDEALGLTYLKNNN